MALVSEIVESSFLQRVTLLQWASIIAGLYMANMLLYPFVLSPVRHIPGPWYARISKLPLQYETYMRRRSQYATRLIKKYGPIVVIAPDQVHTTDDAAMKIIYDQTSLKTSFYSSMGSWKGVTSTLGFIDYHGAAPTRNNLILCFQNKNLATLVENIDSHVMDFIRLIESKAKINEPVDGVVIFRLLALDIVTDILWGEETRLLKNVSDETPDLLRRFHAFSTWNALKSFIPGADLMVRLFGTSKWRQLRNDCNDMDVTAREALNRWENNKDTHREMDVLSMLQAMNDAEDPAKRVPNDHIPAYIVEMLAAGSSTTSHTAAFACWLLSRNESVQERLQEELFEAFPDADGMDFKKTMDLPFLDAVIKETMRLYPMIPGPLERFLGKEVKVDGKVVPRGVVASTAAYNQGRLEEVYPDSEAWDPARWLNANDRMKLNWTPFGYGSRACPGSNLAMTELKYMIGAIFRRFCVRVLKGHESDTLELSDVFAAGTKSGHVWLEFEESRNVLTGVEEHLVTRHDF
ncbi:cytochrome P450 [Zopfia rhizophila CBS 207.26]|uniref:Cytochrome P450 n=1 Tax=Zopfia rhizophila CBS 207.26 TaxID=1314779 RepID=A0A6A6EAS2_9PEZI|nr:cytochrome P450 [Zopfia rhizophila CBS 207.26]